MSELFSQLKIGKTTIKNHLAMSPMAMYKAGYDGCATDWHLVHYGARALGGIGLIIVESTAIDPIGRMTEHDLGLWSDDQIAPLKKITDFVHKQDTKIAIQLNHAGRKAWLDTSRYKTEDIFAPSAIPFHANDKRPIVMNHGQIKHVINTWTQAAIRAEKAGFDAIEIHAAHGFLLHQFLSPLSNQRTDDYGGSLENRMRLLVEVLQSVRKSVSNEMTILVRGSISDWADNGLKPSDWMKVLKTIQNENVDLLECTSGGLVEQEIPHGGACFNLSFAEEMKKFASIPLGTVGGITTPEECAQITEAGKADLIVIGKELLRNPNFGLKAGLVFGKTDFCSDPYKPVFG